MMLHIVHYSLQLPLEKKKKKKQLLASLGQKQENFTSIYSNNQNTIVG
jgi:hypothetical protein